MGLRICLAHSTVCLLLHFVSLVIGSVLGTREASEGVNADVAGCKAPCT